MRSPSAASGGEADARFGRERDDDEQKAYNRQSVRKR
jgi:hypothetical protein